MIFILAENNHPTYINRHMDICFPLEGAYKSRGAASAAVHLAIAEGFGKSVALDIFLSTVFLSPNQRFQYSSM